MIKFESTLVTAAATTPVTRTEAKAHLGVSSTADDDLIDRLILAAVEKIEGTHHIALVTQTRRVKLDDFPPATWKNCRRAYIALDRSPLQSVSSITYIDTAGDTQVLATTYYDVDTDSRPGRVVLAYDQSWPVVRDDHNAVTVTYVCGEGDDETEVPQALRQAVLLEVQKEYDGDCGDCHDRAIASLLAPYSLEAYA